MMSLVVLATTAQNPVRTEYYDDGQIKAEYGFAKNSVVWVSHYYPNGVVREAGRCINGTPDGFWQFWDESGRKICEAYYVEGTKDGKWLYWADNGATQYEVYYDDDKIIEYTKWTRSDMLLEN